jgi:hypothetical protein
LSCVLLCLETGSTPKAIAFNGWLSRYAETQFIEEEEESWRFDGESDARQRDWLGVPMCSLAQRRCQGLAQSDMRWQALTY